MANIYNGDISKLTLPKFTYFINGLYASRTNVFRLGDFQISQNDLEDIKSAIKLRSDINKERKVDRFVQYYRDDSKKVDEKGMTAEIMLGKLLTKIRNNGETKLELILPPVADMVLDKTKQDFVIQNSSNKIMFDVKGQFHNEFSLNLNIRAFNRMKEQSDFFIAGITNCTKDTFDEATKITFYYVDNKWYEEVSKPVLYSRKPNFTPFKTIPLSLLESTSLEDPSVDSWQELLKIA